MSHLPLPDIPAEKLVFPFTPTALILKGIKNVSEWDQDYLEALKMTFLEDVPLKHIVPQEYVPCAEAMDPSFFTLSADQVRDYGFLIESDPQVMAARKSAACMFYYTLEVLATRETRRRASEISLASTSFDDQLDLSLWEDQEEYVTATTLTSLLLPFINSYMFSSPNGEMQFYLREGKYGTVKILGRYPEVDNDGTIRLRRRRSNGESWATVRNFMIPFIKAKRLRHHKHKSQLFGQLGGESLWAAQINAKERPGDQEIFAFGCHRRKVYLTHVFFPEEYLEGVSTPGGPEPNSYVVLKKSIHFDLLEPEQRVEFVRGYWYYELREEWKELGWKDEGR